MRIAYDYQIFSIQNYGGISRYFVELIRRLDNRVRVNARIIAPLYINNYANELNNDIVTGLHLPILPGTARLIKAFNQLVFPQMVGRFSPDILHKTYYSKNATNQCKQTKTVVTVHDMIHERFSEYFTHMDDTALIKRLNVEKADHVICVSENTRQDLIDITGVSPSKVSVVHHGFDLPIKSDKLDGMGLTEPYILYVGERGGYKNFERLLKVYGRKSTMHKHYKLICFGGGKFSQSERLLSKSLGLAANRLIHLVGNDHVLAQLYSNATAFVYPSLYEGFGFPPLEAMSYGCPVICSNGGSIQEVVGNAGEFFDPYDEESMANAIEQVVSSQERADTLRILGRQRITCFSWDDCAEKTYKIYESLKE